MTDENGSGRKERPLPAAWTHNPYQAPSAHVEDVRTSSGAGVLGDPAKVGAGRGAGWFGDGWRIFRSATGTWIGVIVVFFIVTLVLAMIPIIGQIASNVLMPVLTGGLMIGCRAIDDDEEFGFGYLFAGFKKNFGQLLLIGILGFAFAFVVIIGLSVLGIGIGFGAAFLGGKGAGSDAALVTLMIGALVAAFLFVPLAMAMWFAPALVALHDLSAFEAMKLSFRGCLRNMLPFLIYGLVFIVLAIVATIPVGLGWLALGPTLIGSTYAAYRDIFVA